MDYESLVLVLKEKQILSSRSNKIYEDRMVKFIHVELVEFTQKRH